MVVSRKVIGEKAEDSPTFSCLLPLYLSGDTFLPGHLAQHSFEIFCRYALSFPGFRRDDGGRGIEVDTRRLTVGS